MELEDNDSAASVDIDAENSSTIMSPSNAEGRFSTSIVGTSLSKLPSGTSLTKRVIILPIKYAPQPTIAENTVEMTAPLRMAALSFTA